MNIITNAFKSSLGKKYIMAVTGGCLFLFVVGHLAGNLSLSEAVRLVKKETRRYIRQQYNWFRLDDPDIHWFDASGEFYDALCKLVAEFLA